MVCKTDWAREAAFLALFTGVAPPGVDGALRCRNPLCRRPLQKDGTCIRGCSQEEGAALRLPELEALVCLFDDLGAAGDGRWDQDPRISAARRAIRNGGGERDLRVALGGVLSLLDYMYVAGEGVEGDPRVRAARAYVRREALLAWEGLRERWSTFRAAVEDDQGDELPAGGYTELNVALARNHALPLWRQAWAVWRNLGTVLDQQGDSWANVPDEIEAIQEAVVALLRTLPEDRLSEVLARLGFDPEAADLLRLQTIRSLVLQSRHPVQEMHGFWGMNALEELPRLARCMQDGEQACRLMRDMVQNRWNQGLELESTDLDAVGRVGQCLGRIARESASLDQSGYKAGVLLGVVDGAVLERLSPEAIPGVAKGSVLVEVANLHTRACREIGAHPRQFPLRGLQQATERLGLPAEYARNAQREELLLWLEAATYPPRQEGVRVAMARQMVARQHKSIWAMDGTGSVRCYRVGQRVRWVRGEGTIEGCGFDGEAGPGGAIWAARPVVDVRIADQLCRVALVEIEPYPEDFHDLP